MTIKSCSCRDVLQFYESKYTRKFKIITYNLLLCSVVTVCERVLRSSFSETWDYLWNQIIARSTFLWIAKIYTPKIKFFSGLRK